jgi:uncharacterized membrane protein
MPTFPRFPFLPALAVLAIVVVPAVLALDRLGAPVWAMDAVVVGVGVALPFLMRTDREG